ncbi:MAG: Gfo/Idh/MocA family oxidoreductase [Planctomycetes bacterium]|nr:Gfo/Idh/MocA family oxidoreductase [Planctomycetota bacterium]
MSNHLSRRQFIQTSTAIGAGLYVSGKALGADVPKKDVINVALLGAGAQGQVLMDAILKMKSPGIRFVAVCDIWNVNRRRVMKRMKSYSKHYGYRYADYVDYKEMLDTEKDLDAVIVATPDFWHSEHTVACLKKGLHVYCEKEMSNTLEGAKKMVEAQKASGKLLQIGHQRRSNPRYQHCYNNLIKGSNLLGRITTINGQWNRSKASCEDIMDWTKDPEKMKIDQATLEKYGFKDMKQFRNWRWYKGMGGGPIVDLGSHQIDIYSWFLGCNPRSVIASGGTDYWKDHEWYDTVMAIYEYETKQGTVRAMYQTGTTNSSGGYFENFMGDKGTLMVSESAGRGSVYRENWVLEEEWQKWVDKGYITKSEGLPAKKDADEDAVLDVREGSYAPAEYKIPVKMDVPYHQPHLVNFFNTVRGTEKLNCPGEIGYETAATVLKVNEAVAQKKRLEFKPEDFHA